MSRRTKYSEEEAESIKAKLKARPNAPRAMSKADMVQLLIDQIEAMKEQGQSLSEIAAALSESGMEISAATLRNYVYRLKSKPPPTKKAPRKTRKGKDAKPPKQDVSKNKATFHLTQDTSDDDF